MGMLAYARLLAGVYLGVAAAIAAVLAIFGAYAFAGGLLYGAALSAANGFLLARSISQVGSGASSNQAKLAVQGGAVLRFVGSGVLLFLGFYLGLHPLGLLLGFAFFHLIVAFGSLFEAWRTPSRSQREG